MAFDVQEYRAFVELLYKHPEWRAELRQLLLTEEILTLPQFVRELAEIQRRHEERLTRVEERLAGVEERLTRLETVVAELAEAQRRTEQRVEELAEAQRRTEQQVQRLTDRVAQNTGEILEVRYYLRAGTFFWRILLQPQVVSFADLVPFIQGRLDEAQVDDLSLSDLILRGQLRPPLGAEKSHPEAYLAVEVSAVVDREDVERALRRASLLRQAGLLALPVAAGGNATAGAREEAEAKGVILQLDGWTGFLDKALENLSQA